VEEVRDLDIWERQFDIPLREMARVVMEAHGHRRLTAALWSLMPPWAETLEHANQVSTFNAKAESWQRSRASGMLSCGGAASCPLKHSAYECVGPKRKNQPLHIVRRGGKFLSMAGLFSYWKPAGSEGRPIHTFTLVTTVPSHWMARIHNCMPASCRMTGLPPGSIRRLRLPFSWKSSSPLLKSTWSSSLSKRNS